MQANLFDAHPTHRLDVGDGGLWYFPQWLGADEAYRYFDLLREKCAWQQSIIRLAGRDVKIPRLNAWYGDPNTHYRYSNTDFEPLPWIQPLIELRSRLHSHLQSVQCNQVFNSALINCYRDGNDSVSWHADDEPELGNSPFIASLSLGAKRRFLLKRRGEGSIKRGGDAINSGGGTIKLELEHGSLLLMLPPLQKYWLHSLPKTKLPVSERINVTFRHVIVQ